MNEQISMILHDGSNKTLAYGEKTSGIVRIQPVKDMDLNEVTIQLLVESKGKLKPSEYIIDEQHIYIPDETILIAGKVYEYPFELDHRSPNESYEGKNVSVLYSIEAIAEYERGTAPKGIVGKISSFISGRKLKVSQYITTSYDAPYVVHELDNQTFSQESSKGLAFMAIILFALLIALVGLTQLKQLIIGSMLGWAIGGLVISILLGMVLYRLVINMMVGSFRVFEEKQDEEGFTIIIESEKGWNRTYNRQCHYQVIEKVIDTRGTSDSTYRYTLFKSPSQDIVLDDFGGVHLTFEFPYTPIPNVSIEDVSIISELVLSFVISSGLKLRFKVPFSIRKRDNE